jgi:hypothetical protein
MFAHVAFSAFLLALSALLVLFQLRTRRAAARQELSERDRGFFRRQFRRRIQIDAMIGLVGVAVLGGIWVTAPRTQLLYWSGVLLVAVWIGLLAIADMASTRAHWQRLHRRHVADFTALRADLLRRFSGPNDRQQETNEDEADDRQQS